MKEFGELIGVGFLAVVAFVGLFLLFFAIGTAITAVIVALAWNVLGLHEVFNADPLTFWQVVGVAVGINILRSIFSRNVTVSN